MPPTPRPEEPGRMVPVPAGEYLLGDAFDEGYAGDGEGPQHEVELTSFLMDTHCVTNAEFAQFVAATGHVTTAEAEGYSAVFEGAYAGDGSDVLGRAAGTPWWLGVRSADWRRPTGAGSSALPDHPVVHVSHDDALAYATWAGKRLPTEAEWEAGARGGLVGARYPWGDTLLPDGEWRCNIFQGTFPQHNTDEDGWSTTAPAHWFPANGFGIYQAVGNVWEWCQDWFAPDYFLSAPRVEPRGPDHGSNRVMRGGSYLCHDSYCNRYRVAARSASPPDASAGNLGFRCVAEG